MVKIAGYFPTEFLRRWKTHARFSAFLSYVKEISVTLNSPFQSGTRKTRERVGDITQGLLNCCLSVHKLNAFFQHECDVVPSLTSPARH